MNNNKRIVIIGATSAIAEHCARLWLRKHYINLVLVGRNTQRIEQVAADLKVRSPKSEIQIVKAEFLNPEAINATVGDIFKAGHVDIVLIAHGSLPDQLECQLDLQSCYDALEINGISPVLYAEAFAKEMEKRNCGTIALIGSVAGDRGRKSNYIYGAAKGLITRYTQGLQHRFNNTGVKVVLIKPGPTDTPMTAHMKAAGYKLAKLETVAQDILNAISNDKQVVYTPSKWGPIMLTIQHLPKQIFNRLNI